MVPGWLVEATKSAGASYFGVFCGRQRGWKDIFRFYFGLTGAGRRCELVASPVVCFSWHPFSVDRGKYGLQQVDLMAFCSSL